MYVFFGAVLAILAAGLTIAYADGNPVNRTDPDGKSSYPHGDSGGSTSSGTTSNPMTLSSATSQTLSILPHVVGAKVSHVISQHVTAVTSRASSMASSPVGWCSAPAEQRLNGCELRPNTVEVGGTIGICLSGLLFAGVELMGSFCFVVAVNPKTNNSRCSLSRASAIGSRI
jgi:hypothetical protein